MALIKNINTMVADGGGGTKKPAQKPTSASSAYNQQLLSQAPKPTGGSASSAYNAQLVQQAQQAQLEAQREAQRQKELAARRAAGSGSNAYNQYLLDTVPKDQARDPLPPNGDTQGVASAGGGSVVSPSVTADAATATSSEGGTNQNSGYDLSEYLRQQQTARVEAELAGLKDAYEQSLAAYNAALDRLPQDYDAARNAAAAQNAIAQMNFDERANATGLGSGARGQADLARSSVYRGTLAGIDQEQANAVSDIALTKANLQSQYETALAQAKANGDATLANALYQELVRVQGLGREDAQRAQNIALQYGLGKGDSLGKVASIRSIADLAGLIYGGSAARYTGRWTPSPVADEEPDEDKTADSGVVIPEASYITPSGVDARTLGGENYNLILNNILGGTFADYRSAADFIMNATVDGNISRDELAKLDSIARYHLAK